MTDASAAAGQGRGVSTRLRLARVARESALDVRGVATVGSRPVAERATWDGAERLDGVAVTAEPGGRYGVSLWIAARTAPLHELAQEVRAAVASAARRAGLERELGPVDICVDDLVDGDGA